MEAVALASGGITVVGDSTQPIYGANLSYAVNQPRVYFNSSTGYGTLGYALPAAIGAWHADRTQRVLCVIGDGGLQFTVGEMATARQLDASVVMIVWNNHCYGEIRSSMLAAGIEPVGVDIFSPEMQLLAQAFGWHGEVSTEPADLPARVAAAFARGGPSLIEVDEASYLERWGNR